MPEQSFLFLCSQHCYGDFKQDGGAIPTHHSRCSSPPCTDRMSSPFPRKRERPGKEGGGRDRCIASPRRSHPPAMQGRLLPILLHRLPPPQHPTHPFPRLCLPELGHQLGMQQLPGGGGSQPFAPPQAPQRASPLSLHPLRIRSIPLSPRI